MDPVEDGVQVQCLYGEADNPEEESPLRSEAAAAAQTPPRWRVPIVSVMVIAAILFCQALDATGVVYATDPVAFHVLTNPWFNNGGFVLHTLPNVVLFALATVPAELAVGSLNCLLPWLMNLYFVVPFTYFRHGGWRGNGNGSSIQVYFQFTVFGGALFLAKFLFPALDTKAAPGEKGETGRKWTLPSAGRALLWWLLGLTLLFCAGWVWNGLILGAVALAEAADVMPPMNLAHFVHDVFCGMGYFGTLLLGALLWYQNTMGAADALKDVEVELGIFKIVWVKRMFRGECSKEKGQLLVPAKNHPVFPYCREIMLVLITAFCFVFGTWLLFGLAVCNATDHLNTIQTITHFRKKF